MTTATISNECATPRQTFAIWCIIKKDVRKYNLSKNEASEIISCLKNNTPLSESLSQRIEYIPQTKEYVSSNSLDQTHNIVALPVKPSLTVAKIYKEAHEAGMEAGNKCQTQPCHVMQNDKVIDTIPDICGFAGIYVKGNNGNTRKFKEWYLKNIDSRAKSDVGICVYVYQFGQSYNRKSSYAYAFANVLEKYGIAARVWSRED